jgi:hypothetical protein
MVVQHMSSKINHLLPKNITTSTYLVVHQVGYISVTKKSQLGSTNLALGCSLIHQVTNSVCDKSLHVSKICNRGG